MADNTGWGEWGRYVLEEIKRLNVCMGAVKADVAALRAESIDDDRELRDGLEERLREAETQIGRLEERLKVLAVAQSVFTSIAATLAAWFGGRS